MSDHRTVHTVAAKNALEMYEKEGEEYWLKKGKGAIEREIND